MSQRIAAVMSLLAFSICLVSGLQASNSFGTTVSRALMAMGVTLVIGLIVGAMAQRMLDENLTAEQAKSKISSNKSESSDR